MVASPSAARVRLRRRVPRPWELLSFVAAPGSGSALDRCADVGDVRRLARRRVPRSVFDYVDGAAEAETGIERARDAFRDIEFVPRVLRAVGQVDTSTRLLGRDYGLPLVLAPVGFTRIAHAAGERAVAPAAARFDVPYALSTMGTTTVEEFAGLLPEGNRWFQLYLWKDRDASRALIDRAREAGCTTLVLTVDTPVSGMRGRDVRNGFAIPPSLSARTVADISRKPRWWFDLLTTAPLEFAALGSSGTFAEQVGQILDPDVTMADFEWLREIWPGTIVVKGVHHPDDARQLVGLGADAIAVSSHGGRQLDRVTPPLRTLPAIVEAVDGRAQVLLDSGVLSGADVVAALALGADGCLVGRAYLYGLMAGGAPGVDRVLTLLGSGIRRTMALLGVDRIADLRPEHVRWTSTGRAVMADG